MDYSHLKKFYQGKKVFLTGHTGFKGSWMLTWLHLLGANVKGYALEPENDYDLYHLINGDSLCNSIIGDVRNKEKLVNEIIAFQPDYIFHLAAQPLVRLSYEIPAETFEVNAIGSAHLLDGVRELKKPCVVVMITTDKVYENLEWHHPYRENDRLGGYDPYSASKACAELIISSYRQSFFNKKDFESHKKAISSARAGNVIGGGDWAKDRIIPDIIHALQDSVPVNLRNPNAIRPWQHVLEPIGGYLHLATRMIDDPLKYSDSWNFGPYDNDCLTVEALVKIAINIWGNGEYKTPDQPPTLHEASLLKLDISKATNILNWYPKYNSKEAIQKTIDWYKKSSVEPDSAFNLLSQSIRRYEKE